MSNISQDVLKNLKEAMTTRSFATPHLSNQAPEQWQADYDKRKAAESLAALSLIQGDFSEPARYPGYRSHGWEGLGILVVGAVTKKSRPLVEVGPLRFQLEKKAEFERAGVIAGMMLPVEVEVIGR